jgi:PilZ domain
MTMNFLRSGARIPVELPVEITWKNRTGRPQRAQGKTSTMSGNGLYMTVPVRLRASTPISIVVTLPVELTRKPLELLCQGRVVRQEKSKTSAGVGAIIDDYRFRPSNREV